MINHEQHMNTELMQRQQVKRVLNMFVRRKKIIAFSIIITMAIGIGYYLRQPKIYQSSSLIMYQQKVNPTSMSPDESRFIEIVNSVSQQILSRTSLEGLINQFDLYKEARAQRPLEDIIEIMRTSHIDIKPDSSGNVFQVSYQGNQPRKVLLVTNALAAKFIEENIRLREIFVSETSSYIQDELSMAKEVINKKEAAMRDYKLKYYNEMPDRLPDNISRLNALQEQYQNYQENLQDLERTKVLLQEQITFRSDFLKGLTDIDGAALSSGMPGLSPTEKLTKYNSELKMLLARYTENHPDIKRLRSQISQLEKELGEKLITQRDDVEYTLSKLKKEKDVIMADIKKHQKWIEAAPIREAEWTDLTRDYTQFSNNYQALVERSLRAESAENLEKRQKGSQFKIIDPAQFPEKPFKPDFMRIMFISLAVSFVLGGLFSFTLEFLDTSFRDPHDLEQFLGVPVTCTIPVIQTSADARKAMLLRTFWWLLLIVALATLGAGIFYLVKNGYIII
jgi:polysaccharide chain length determinant protein (PEP-CTERM system associated)